MKNSIDVMSGGVDSWTLVLCFFAASGFAWVIAALDLRRSRIRYVQPVLRSLSSAAALVAMTLLLLNVSLGFTSAATLGAVVTWAAHLHECWDVIETAAFWTTCALFLILIATSLRGSDFGTEWPSRLKKAIDAMHTPSLILFVCSCIAVAGPTAVGAQAGMLLVARSPQEHAGISPVLKESTAPSPQPLTETQKEQLYWRVRRNERVLANVVIARMTAAARQKLLRYAEQREYAFEHVYACQFETCWKANEDFPVSEEGQTYVLSRNASDWPRQVVNESKPDAPTDPRGRARELAEDLVLTVASHFIGQIVSSDASAGGLARNIAGDALSDATEKVFRRAFALWPHAAGSVRRELEASRLRDIRTVSTVVSLWCKQRLPDRFTVADEIQTIERERKAQEEELERERARAEEHDIRIP